MARRNIVLGENLCEGGGIGLHAFERLGSLHEVAARHEEIAEHFVVVGGTERLAEERFGLVEAMLAHGDERCVGVGLGKFGGFSPIQPWPFPNRPWHSDLRQTVVRTLVVGIKTGGLFENGLALFEVVRERGGIKHLFYRKFGSVVDILLADFIVGAADNAVVDGQTRATELGSTSSASSVNAAEMLRICCSRSSGSW